MKKKNNFEAMVKTDFFVPPIITEIDLYEENDSEKDEEKDAEVLLYVLAKRY